jgi:hypothetical protein
VRHFVERANQDAKSETGWDELPAREYRSCRPNKPPAWWSQAQRRVPGYTQSSIVEVATTQNIYNRLAAHLVAIKRVADAAAIRGWVR